MPVHCAPPYGSIQRVTHTRSLNKAAAGLAYGVYLLWPTALWCAVRRYSSAMRLCGASGTR
eukprot:128126-Prymnesium_polylepis.1